MLSVIRCSIKLFFASFALFYFFLFSVGCNNKPVLDEKYVSALQVKPPVPPPVPSPVPPVDENPPVKEVPETRPADVITEEKKLSVVHTRSIETLQQDGIYDLENNAVFTLQDPHVAMGDFPLDRRKQINWVETLDAGLIQPRADLKGERDMLVMDMDIIMKNTQSMPYVKFPHKAHTKWLDCSNCHPKIFIPRKRANPISMNKVLRGQYCGVCHDKVAFSLFICERCHSVPHEGSGKKWW